MEQKKILWVIISVSAFVLIVFGVALLLYSPERSRNTAFSTDLTQYDDAQGYSTSVVDPDMWTRSPDSIPAVDSDAKTVAGNVTNLTIVNGLPQSNSIDVSTLAEPDAVGRDTLPEELAKQIDASKKGTASEGSSNNATNSKTPSIKVSDAKESKKIINLPSKKQSISSAAPKTAQKKASVKKISASKTKELFWVQTAAFGSKLNAEHARERLAERNMKVEIFTKNTTQGVVHRVRVGPFSNKTEADYWLKNIQKMGGFNDSYVTQETLH